MALTRLIFPFAFLTLLIFIASAEYLPHTQPQNPDHVEYTHQQQPLDLNHDHQKHDDNDLLGSTLNLDVDDLLDNVIGGDGDHNEHDKPQGQGNFVPTDPSYEKTKPYYGHEPKSTTYQGQGNFVPVDSTYQKTKAYEGQEHNVPSKQYYGHEQKTYDQVHEGKYLNVNYIAIQGYVLCESEANIYNPVKGAVVEVTCLRSYENGYKKDSYSNILRLQTDEKGYFSEILPVAELTNNYVNLKKCKAYPKYSPSKTCNIPAYGASNGVHLSLLRSEEGKAYYTVGNLIYTPNTHYYVPNKEPVSKYPPVQNGY